MNLILRIKMKYILLQDGVLMGNTGHWELLSCITEPNQENADRLIIGAGHLKLENGKIKCWGESATFGIHSREEDADRIKELLSGK